MAAPSAGTARSLKQVTSSSCSTLPPVSSPTSPLNSTLRASGGGGSSASSPTRRGTRDSGGTASPTRRGTRDSGGTASPTLRGPPPTQLLSPAHSSSTLLETESPSNYRVWVRLLGPEEQNQKARLEKHITTTELRKAIKTKTGVQVNELQLTVDGELLMEGAAQPFLHKSPHDELVVHWEKVDRLVSLMKQRHLTTINSRGKFDRTTLHFAVLDGEVDLCRRVIEHEDREKDLLNVRDVFHDTPLILASILGYIELVELLMDRQANLLCQNLCGRTALQLAAEHGHKKVTKTLLQEDANLGMGPARVGPMGLTNISRSAPYLAELNERHQAKHRIKIYKMSRKSLANINF